MTLLQKNSLFIEWPYYKKSHLLNDPITKDSPYSLNDPITKFPIYWMTL